MFQSSDSSKLILASFLFLLLAGSGQAAAAAIAVANPSFETDGLCDGCNANSITDWLTTSGGGDGIFNPSATSYPGGMVPDGDNVAYVNLSGNRVNQTLSAVLEADMEYTLEVEVGNRLDTAFAGYIVQLRAGGVILAQDDSTLSPMPGEFLTSTVTYTADPADPQLGQNLEIWLLAPNVQANFDDVRLNAIMVPVELMRFSIE